MDNSNPYFVAELETGYVVLGDYQFYRGYTIFICKEHKQELHELDVDFKVKFLKEMSVVAEAVHLALKPHKLNYELLGNLYNHLHWHIFPRYKDDVNPSLPIWCVKEDVRCNKKYIPSEKELEKLKKKLLDKLKLIKCY
ncbi:MAG: diadenosine tetraphosphate (Ap4A) hydrolase like protein HIT family hydrolase [uncultured bacterium]|nr:MAG: diadenosine tetraphosphate (Ap4A) hydrolase like protein HIT family hydrolase [uncultured bacterium]